MVGRLTSFQIVAMICTGGMQPQECAPAPGYSRDVAVVGEVANELSCLREAQMDLAKSSPFRNLDQGEFIKIMCLRRTN